MKLRLYIIRIVYLFLFISLNGVAQNMRIIDSLNKVLLLTKTDTQRISILGLISDASGNFNNAKSLEVALKELELGEKTEFIAYKAMAYLDAAHAYWRIDQFATSLEYANKALLIYEGMNNDAGKMECYLTIGNCYDTEFKKAEEYYLKALKLAEKTGDLFTEGACLTNIAAINESEDPKTIEQNNIYIRKAAEIFKKLKHNHAYNLAIRNMGDNYRRLKNFPEAFKYYRESGRYCILVGLYNTYVNLLIREAAIFTELKQFDSIRGLIAEAEVLRDKVDSKVFVSILSLKLDFYQDQGRYDSAAFYYEKCLSVARGVGEDQLILQVLSSYASFCLNQLEDNEKASKLYGEVITLARKTHDLDRLWLAEYNFGLSLKNLAKYERASVFLDSALILRDSVDKLKEQQTMQGLLEQHKMAALEDNFKEEQSQNQLQQAELERASLQKYSLTAGLTLVFFLGLISFRGYKRKKKDNIVLELQKREIEERNLALNTANIVIAEKNKNITDSIEYAKRIQQTLLTSDEYLRSVFKDHFIYFQPKDIIGGDFYWAYQTQDKVYNIFAVGDCTGHGVPGALMTMLSNSFLNEIVIENGITQPDEILNRLRTKIIKTLDSGQSGQKDGMDVAICVIETRTNTMNFAGANNAAWIVRKGEITVLSPDKMPVGIFERMDSFSKKEFALELGDMIYISSDGYGDQFGGSDGKKYKSGRVRDYVSYLSDKPLKDQRDLLRKNLVDWQGAFEQTDDICIMGIRV
jgi:serine phosphatase RsbU (regulator of sigma subunit)